MSFAIRGSTRRFAPEGSPLGALEQGPTEGLTEDDAFEVSSKIG